MWKNGLKQEALICEDGLNQARGFTRALEAGPLFASRPSPFRHGGDGESGRFGVRAMRTLLAAGPSASQMHSGTFSIVLCVHLSA